MKSIFPLSASGSNYISLWLLCSSVIACIIRAYVCVCVCVCTVYSPQPHLSHSQSSSSSSLSTGSSHSCKGQRALLRGRMRMWWCMHHSPVGTLFSPSQWEIRFSSPLGFHIHIATHPSTTTQTDTHTHSNTHTIHVSNHNILLWNFEFSNL